MRYLLFGLLAAIMCARNCAAEPDYAAELISRAHEQKLSDDPIWHRLVHYKKNLLFPGYTSFADDPTFFRSPDGKTDPAAELDETLRAFFSEEPETEKIQHPQCAFPARYHWLKERLAFDSARLAEQSCKRFHEWRDALQPENVTLVYPAAYLNNPASMFGHTLLRIDAEGQSEETRLLAYGASYAAATNERSGLVFAVRGIFGGYKGVFAIAPYYKQVAKYSDLENRDIWEYELEFTPEEREQMIRHLWELGSVWFDYYFFDENCAYHLLSLFDSVRPSLALSDQFPLWAIPSDTVRAVVHSAGLVKRAVYRPSNSTIVKAQMAELPYDRQMQALELSRGTLSPDDASIVQLPEEQRARTLELAFDYLNYRRLSGKAQADEVPSVGRNLLIARSKITADIPALEVPVPKIRPEEGHDTARFRLSAGADDGRAYSLYEYRPAYHDLLDPQSGYTSGAELKFFGMSFRQDEGDSLRLQDFTPLSIRSLSPRDEFFKPISWKVDFGLRRQELPDRKHGILLTQGEGGAGVSYAPLPGTLLFAMTEATLEYTTDYDDDYALGLTPDIGAYIDLSDALRVGIRGKSKHFFLGEEHREQEISVEARYELNHWSALHALIAHRFEFGDYRNVGELGWQVYF